MACDLVVREDGEVYLMEVNINPAFGTFHERTEQRLIGPLFADLIRLCVLPAASGLAASSPQPGRFRKVREAGGLAEALARGGDTASDELQAHQAYVTFKKSSCKKYERKAGATQERDTPVAA